MLLSNTEFIKRLNQVERSFDEDVVSQSIGSNILLAESQRQDAQGILDAIERKIELAEIALSSTQKVMEEERPENTSRKAFDGARAERSETEETIVANLEELGTEKQDFLDAHGAIIAFDPEVYREAKTTEMANSLSSGFGHPKFGIQHAGGHFPKELLPDWVVDQADREIPSWADTVNNLDEPLGSEPGSDYPSFNVKPF